jgi:Raf kinase inhibitor-like YbhB/YbcL family protein
MMAVKNTLIVTSVFVDGGKIPIEYTGHGKDISPKLFLSEVSDKAKTLAVIMDDINHPIFKVYNHWTIWNLPVTQEIPEGIPHGEILSDFGGAVQGIGYGRHRYRGPKPPFGATHKYHYHVYALDRRLDLKPKSKKADLLRAMNGHILQHGCLTGAYK